MTSHSHDVPSAVHHGYRGKGYWLVGSDSGVFTFGDAGYHGSVPGDRIAISDAIGLLPAPTGAGYWVVTKDGRVSAFGTATSQTGKTPTAPVVGTAAA